MTNNVEIVITEDNSVTLFSKDFNETYHSVKGATEESEHVFINAGFNQINKEKINIFEVGFGTGLNALLTVFAATERNKTVNYFSIEKFPVSADIIEKFAESLSADKKEMFEKIHTCKWNEETSISPNFNLTKIEGDYTEYKFENKFDLIYFDAFSFDTQPEMWSLDNFIKINKALNAEGLLVTYSSKGIVKQNLRSAGFEVKRLSGYKKRHMLKAEKK